MKSMSSLIIVISFASILISCKKEHIQSENVLFGTWVKGTNAGDTLQFMRINNKNILRYNISFNAAMPAFKEVEYKYQDGKLGIKLYYPTVQDFYPINSFTWKQVRSEFEIQGIELFSILSSTQVYFTYRKI
jgi:hypothetical protein